MRPLYTTTGTATKWDYCSSVSHMAKEFQENLDSFSCSMLGPLQIIHCGPFLKTGKAAVEN